jgi:hypothetical protein
MHMRQVVSAQTLKTDAWSKTIRGQVLLRERMSVNTECDPSENLNKSTHLDDL